MTELVTITKEIISLQGIHENVSAVKRLSKFYNQITADGKYFDIIPDNEQYITGGQDLSTYHAAVCIANSSSNPIPKIRQCKSAYSITSVSGSQD